MKVSIIVRTYNRAYILAEALESALKQSFTDFEIIVVDDASSDNTEEVVRKFHDDRIELIRHSQNKGVAAANNTGVQAAQGEFIAWLDSDDTWKPDKIDRQVKFLASHPEVDAVFSDVEIVDGPTRHPSLVSLLRVFPGMLASRPKAIEHVFNQREMYLCLLEEIAIKPTALLIRRDVFKALGMFDEQSRSGEDWEFLLRLSHSSRFGYIDAPLACQRWMPDATHQNFFEHDRTYLLGVFAREKTFAKHDPQALKAINGVIATFSTSLAYRYLCQNNRSKAIATYWSGFKETKNLKMLLKTTAALLPLGVRSAALRTVRKLTKSNRRDFY
jgi:glycosyltransferase involved in cell wall biosynthesis